jgi:hypothetical protein
MEVEVVARTAPCATPHGTTPASRGRIGLADQGARGGRPAGTATPSILEGKSPAEIVAMRRRGDLDGLLRGE